MNVLLATALIAAALLVTPALRAGPVLTQEGFASIPHVHGLAVDPFDSQALWVATHEGLYQLIDRSAWRRIGADKTDLMGFTVHPKDRGVLLTSGHPGPGDQRPNPLGLAISRDAGLRWTAVSLEGEKDFHAMAISPVDAQAIYAWNVWKGEGLYRSRDGGRIWSSLGRLGVSEVFALRADPRDPEAIMAATNAGLLRSRDAGATWSPVHSRLTGVPVTALDVSPRNPSVIYAYTAASHLGLVKSLDGGQTWSSMGFHLGDRDSVTHLAVGSEDPLVLYIATAVGSLLWSPDGGRSYRRLVNQGRIELP